MEDVIKSTQAAEAALKRKAEPNHPASRPATLYRENAAQTEVANLDGANPNAQLKFQAALQTELRECQEELTKMQMQAKALKRDKDRLAEELDAATKKNLGIMVLKDNHFGDGGGGGRDRNGGEEDPSSGGGGGNGGSSNVITEEEMDETVNALLEMITSEREAKSVLEGHLERAMTELDAEREAHVAMKDALSAHKDTTAEEFTAQEQKLREATGIISELRQALLQVMHEKVESQAATDPGLSS